MGLIRVTADACWTRQISGALPPPTGRFRSFPQSALAEAPRPLTGPLADFGIQEISGFLITLLIVLRPRNSAPSFPRFPPQAGSNLGYRFLHLESPNFGRKRNLKRTIETPPIDLGGRHIFAAGYFVKFRPAKIGSRYEDSGHLRDLVCLFSVPPTMCNFNKPRNVSD